RVIAPEMRGHGLSDDPAELPYSMEGLVDDLELVLGTLNVQNPFFLIAHSFGGAIATEYTLRSPENLLGLVLVGVPSRFILHSYVRNLMKVPDPIFSFLAKTIGVALYAPQRTLKRMLDNVMGRWQ